MFCRVPILPKEVSGQKVVYFQPGTIANTVPVPEAIRADLELVRSSEIIPTKSFIETSKKNETQEREIPFSIKERDRNKVFGNARHRTIEKGRRIKEKLLFEQLEDLFTSREEKCINKDQVLQDATKTIKDEAGREKDLVKQKGELMVALLTKLYLLVKKKADLKDTCQKHTRTGVQLNHLLKKEQTIFSEPSRLITLLKNICFSCHHVYLDINDESQLISHKPCASDENITKKEICELIMMQCEKARLSTYSPPSTLSTSSSLSSSTTSLSSSIVNDQEDEDENWPQEYENTKENKHEEVPTVFDEAELGLNIDDVIDSLH